MANDTHRWVGDHAQEVAVGDKRIMLAPGDFVAFKSEDLKNPDNRHILEGGQMMELKESKNA